MPAVIILRIHDDGHAREVLAAGVRDLGQSFLPSAGINPDSVSICYRSPEDEKAAQAGQLDFKEVRDLWIK